MKKSSIALVVSLSTALLMGACEMDVPNLNGLDLSEVTENPTPELLSDVATGLLINNRAGVAGGNGYVSILGVLGRESYNIDPADPRFLVELLEIEALNPGSPAFGANFWTGPYNNIRNASLLIAALDKTENLSDGDKKAFEGFAQTIQALDFLVVLNTRHDNGAPIEQPTEQYSSGPGALVSRADLFAHIKTLLDDGKSAIEAADSDFPFTLTRGFTAFDDPDRPQFHTPDGFIRFNRAIRARVSAYEASLETDAAQRMLYLEEAMAALEESFIDRGAALDDGVYHVYTTNRGDVLNGLSDPKVVAHPATLVSAQINTATGNVDDRAGRKLITRERLVGGGGKYSSELRFAAYYRKNTAPIPIIRNEELLLLRAEVNIGMGNYDEALEDLNFVRVNSGKLSPLTELTELNAIDVLLYERRYSLLFEGGHRWIDMRRFGRLDELLNDDETDELNVHMHFPIPSTECNARELTAAECKAPAGS